MDEWNDLVERRGDMNGNRLRLIRQDDGDMIIAVVPAPDTRFTERDSVEFCIPGTGGGKSTHTHKALIELFKAIEKDNKERPIAK